MDSDRLSFPKLTRRKFFTVGGVSVAGYAALSTIQPFNVKASRKVNARSSAEFVVFLFLEGGASQTDTFDLKEGPWTPADFDARTIGPELKMPYGLLPKLAAINSKYALVRCCEAWESAHARAQYYIQVGHVFSPSRIKEMPSVGSIVAQEMSRRAKQEDFLPPFVAMNYSGSQAGLVGSGMLPATYAPMAIQSRGELPFVVPPEQRETLTRRRGLLDRLDAALRLGEDPRGRALQDYGNFYSASYQMLDSPQMPTIFRVSSEDRQRYGSSDTGDACVMARNLIAADAGARFIAIAHNGWDLHGNAYEKQAKNNQYRLCWDLDSALSAFLTDLESRTDSSGRSLLSKTLVVVMGEFGRTPGPLTLGKGRDHHRYAATALFAGAGVKGGKILGATDSLGAKVTRYDWHQKRSVYPEDVVCTIYSALGIDWTKKVTETPSGRAFYYVEDLSPLGYMEFDDISELFV